MQAPDSSSKLPTGAVSAQSMAECNLPLFGRAEHAWHQCSSTSEEGVMAQVPRMPQLPEAKVHVCQCKCACKLMPGPSVFIRQDS